MTSLQLDDREKNLFHEWLMEREQLLKDQLEVLKGLHKKLQTEEEIKEEEIKQTTPIKEETKDEEIKTPFKQNTSKKDEDFSSWINLIKNELKHLADPVPSGDIVKRLLQRPNLSEKGKRFITKAVTSKLWLLQDRGEVIKSRENGKYVYSLKQ